MNITLPTVTEQAEAIKDGRRFELVCSVLGKGTLDISDYETVFTITSRQLMEHLKRNYTLQDLVKNRPSTQDGFYVVPHRKGVLTYRQEREIHFNEKLVQSTDDAWIQYISIELGYEFHA